jgi:hypothetical protein
MLFYSEGRIYQSEEKAKKMMHGYYIKGRNHIVLQKLNSDTKNQRKL